MSYNIVIAGCVECSVVSLKAAGHALAFYRALGHKPRLFFSISSDHIGDEIDEEGQLVQQHTVMTTSDFAQYVKTFS